jgi:SagB-type dehydrogenase family enzyme
MDDSRLKRPSTVVVSWIGQKLVIDNYRLGKRTAVDALTLDILSYLNDWKSKLEIFVQFPEYAAISLDSVLEDLVAHNLLLREGTVEACHDAEIDRAWGPWSPSAAWFHFSTKDVSYVALGSATEAKIREFLENSPEPSAFKDMATQRPSYQLAIPEDPVDPFYNLLKARRTRRQFSPLPIQYDDLAKLLIYTWGVTGYQHVALLRPLPLKTSPSGGGRHPGEVYVMALRVEGIEPGFYYFSPLENSLYRIASGATPEQAISFCGNQDWVGGTAALFFMTAVFARSMWKYPHPRMYRILSAEFGHFCQTFCLTATSLNLATFSTMALADTAIERLLGLDGVTESVFYIAGVGLPAES